MVAMSANLRSAKRVCWLSESNVTTCVVSGGQLKQGLQQVKATHGGNTAATNMVTNNMGLRDATRQSHTKKKNSTSEQV